MNIFIEVCNFLFIFLFFAIGWFGPSLVAKYIARSESPFWTSANFHRMIIAFLIYYPIYYFVLKGYLSGGKV